MATSVIESIRHDQHAQILCQTVHSEDGAPDCIILNIGMVSIFPSMEQLKRIRRAVVDYIIEQEAPKALAECEPVGAI